MGVGLTPPPPDVEVGLAALPPDVGGGLTSTETETGSRMERAVSSSLHRAQENSSRPSIEQLMVFSEERSDRNLRIKVD